MEGTLCLQQEEKKMNLDSIKVSIKVHEGYRDTIYLDSLGKATIGYGHLITPQDSFEEGVQYDKELLEALFEKDFNNAKEQMESFCATYKLDIPDEVKGVLLEMIFQLGIGTLHKFKKFIAALQENNWINAADEMIDSRWHQQTPERCKALANRIRSI